MMVAMIAPMLGINPFDPLFLLTLLPVIALGSIGWLASAVAAPSLR